MLRVLKVKKALRSLIDYPSIVSDFWSIQIYSLDEEKEKKTFFFKNKDRQRTMLCYEKQHLPRQWYQPLHLGN